MAVVLEIIDLVACWKIHGCGCVADDPEPRKSKKIIYLALIYFVSLGVGGVSWWMVSQHVSCNVRFLFVPYIYQFQANVTTYPI